MTAARSVIKMRITSIISSVTEGKGENFVLDIPLLEDDLKESASGCGGRGIPYGISIDFRLESLARSGFCRKYEVCTSL
jgi:hypothetical protein